ncbi:MAG TPA: Fic family protein, partial [Candidatus Kapabacteria bacterium]|nr:Fic family protein [Candidatus Kapabacteria bacterium]
LRSFEKLLERHTPCRGTKHVVARKLAEVHAEFLFIHPFRDGNGRIARLLAMVMALQAGFAPPEYRFTGRGSTRTRVRYINALQQGYVENYQPLEEFFFDALTGGGEFLVGDEKES